MDNEKTIETAEAVAPVEETPVAAPAEETAAPAAEQTAPAAGTEERPAKPYRQNGNVNRKKKKVCVFCQDKVPFIDYKDANKLRKFTSERGKILPRRITGTCTMHQRHLTTAIKRARQIALLPYTAD